MFAVFTGSITYMNAQSMLSQLRINNYKLIIDHRDRSNIELLVWH